MFYTPSQTTYLDYAMRHDPSLLPDLYNQYSNVQPIDPNQTAQFADTARSEYLRHVVAPNVANARVQGGTTDNAYAASAAAADKAQGEAEAQQVYNDTYNKQNQNQINLQTYNQNAGDAALGGYMGAYGPQEAKVAGSRPSQFAEMGMKSPMSYLYGSQTVSPWSMLTKGASGGAYGLGMLGQTGPGQWLGQQANRGFNYARQGLSGLFGGGPQPAPAPAWYQPGAWNPGENTSPIASNKPFGADAFGYSSTNGET